DPAQEIRISPMRRDLSVIAAPLPPALHPTSLSFPSIWRHGQDRQDRYLLTRISSTPPSPSSLPHAPAHQRANVFRAGIPSSPGGACCTGRLRRDRPVQLHRPDHHCSGRAWEFLNDRDSFLARAEAIVPYSSKSYHRRDRMPDRVLV